MLKDKDGENIVEKMLASVPQEIYLPAKTHYDANEIRAAYLKMTHWIKEIEVLGKKVDVPMSQEEIDEVSQGMLNTFFKILDGKTQDNSF